MSSSRTQQSNESVLSSNSKSINCQESIGSLKHSKSSIQLMKTYLVKKAENMYKLNFSDEEAWKWKLSKAKNPRPLSSFRLIKKENNDQNQIASISLQDLKDYSFPVLRFRTKQLVIFAQKILASNPYFKQSLNDQSFLTNLITQISLNYNIVSYHNFSHAFSLTLMLYQCFEYHKELQSVYTDEERFYALVAGLAHDMNHPGTNNAYEVKTKSTRALEFKNESVLQNFHLKSLWKLLDTNKAINFLSKVPDPQKIKKHITHLILTTDVAQHFKNLQKLKTLRTQHSPQQLLSSSQHKQFFLGQLFHACDIGNPCVDFDNYISWAALLSYQFNQQTILEKENQVEVSEMMRYKGLKSFYQGQVGFINFLVMPLWKEIAQVCENLNVFVNNVEVNLKMLAEKVQTSKDETE